MQGRDETTNTRARLSSGAVVLPEAPQNTIRLRLTGFLFFRAIVLSALLISTIFVHVGEGTDLFGRYVLGIYAVCVTGFVAILIGALGIRRYPERHLEKLAYFQLATDTLVAAALSVLTGGISSAFVFMFFLTILNAAVVLHRRATFIVAVSSFFVYAALYAAQGTGMLAIVGIRAPRSAWDLASTFTMNSLALFLIAALVDYLTEQLRRTTQSLNQTQESLEQLEEIHGAVLTSLPSGVVTIDAARKVIFANDAGARILGFTQKELYSMSLNELFGDTPLMAGARFERVLPSMQIIGGTVSKLAGDVEGNVVIFQDLSELRRLQEDVARDDRLATVGRFAAGLAHEIRNPLASMIGCLDLLQMDITDAEDTKMLKIVQLEAKRLNALVTEFLTYARPALPQKTDIDLLSLIEETVRTFATTAPEIKIVVDGSPTNAFCDASKIRQVLWNLLGNAKEATERITEREGFSPSIKVSLNDVKGFARICIDDNGPGISKEQSENIFEPFFTTRERGTGLGLSTCYQIVDQHKGRIRVGVSSAGRGARFEVVLPQAHGAEFSDAEHSSSSGQWYSAPSPTNLSGRESTSLVPTPSS